MDFDIKAWKFPEEVDRSLGGKTPLVLDVFGRIEGGMIYDKVKRLFSIRADQSLLLLIDSPGGDLSGAMLSDCIRQLSVPVAALGVGCVHSMALSIYLNVPKENRLSLKSATFLAHRGKAGLSMTSRPIIDLLQDNIGNLSKEEAMRWFGFIWNENMMFEKLMREEICRAINGDKVKIDGFTISLDEFLRWEAPISAEVAQNIGFVGHII